MMNNLSFKNIKGLLSRDEMRQIKGGSGRYKKCKRCRVQSDCPGAGTACASGIPYCPDSLKRCM